MNKKRTILTLSNSAIKQIKSIMSENKDAIGLRIFITTKGCSGLSYSMEYVSKKVDCDEEINQDNVRIFIDPKAIMFIIGTEMDYRYSNLESGFLFINPNEKGKCGCGESFHV